ncbi:MAG: hypothetical protein HY731_13790 [Candidatus Tectomicrobia bacterium]|nr:hypothetical protein [Candidatus Tectomicrobia bacterium]
MATLKRQKVQRSSEEPLVAEEQVFRQKLTQLLRRYKGQFIALYQGRVVGHGKDDEELARQMFEKLGDVPFYIARVEKEPTVYELPSPEVVL